jgi:hypothetical protein
VGWILQIHGKELLYTPTLKTASHRHSPYTPYPHAVQEIALNIFDGDALLFFPAFALHLALALLRPALFLLHLPPAAQSSFPVDLPFDLKASVVVTRGPSTKDNNLNGSASFGQSSGQHASLGQGQQASSAQHASFGQQASFGQGQQASSDQPANFGQPFSWSSRHQPVVWMEA